ncbi:type II toxin-antitoxin system VapC family toxin [Anatilimnocola floriformis]|uniref:type II toxin-antitoxin system VapC family toxin n=1 Tax=Anatilimnocola floriformis TaxID=2948575 RepID=UPI0020C4F588|nr:type II toxin-antitoxin system VapC family toxin [Anatilimnocola floriformis]
MEKKLAEHVEDEIYVPIIAFHEQVTGWAAYLNQKRTPEQTTKAYERFAAILHDFSEAEIAGFDAAAVGLFNFLRSQGVRIGTMDLRIASIALARNWTVLTRNTVDFAKVPNLKIEDWTI